MRAQRGQVNAEALATSCTPLSARAALLGPGTGPPGGWPPPWPLFSALRLGRKRCP